MAVMRQFPDIPITALIDGTPRYNLGESMGPDLTVAELGRGDLASVRLGYGTSSGDPELRALVAARLGIPGDQVLITSGAAVALFLLSVLQGDGETVVGVPCFPPTLDALRGTGARIVTVRSRFEHGYRMDLDAFAAALSPRTQLVTVASPQNPSGVLITQDDFDQMLALMGRQCPGAFLLIDETFREAVYAGTLPAPSCATKSPRVLTCGSLSKAYGTPGLRIGWLTVPDPELREQLRRAKFNSALSCGAVDEFLASAVLSQADELLAKRGTLLAQARDIVQRWVEKQDGRAGWIPPDAGAICSVRLDPAQDPDRFHAELSRRQTLVARGPWFQDSPDVFRLGFGYEPPDRLELALEEISSALRLSRVSASGGLHHS
jgi:aspartate/methionine/tyrosine aminotransferase